MLLLRVMLICLVLTGTASAESVRVAVAISLKETMAEIADAYKKDGGDEVEFTFGSSGQLMAQIRSGAPIDAFISAADKQVEDLEKLKLADPATRRVVVYNRLVLIAPANARRPPRGFEDLADSRHARIAIGEPRTVPAGQYAMQVLTKLKVAESLGDRVVFGSNVRQVLDYVERGEVAAGIVYLTDAQESGSKVAVHAVADLSMHDPIVYPGVVVKASAQSGAAKRFLDYLSSEKARGVFAAKGFTTRDPANVSSK